LKNYRGEKKLLNKNIGVGVTLGRQSNLTYDSGVGVIGQYFSENEYANYLFYIVSKRFNNLLPLQNPYNYSEQ
jgi:hypothetical protein